MKSSIRTAFIPAVAICLATPAFAHPGHGDPLGLTHGFMHPLSGADHVLAMIAVGLYAAQLGGRAMWMLPAAFMTAMIAGGAMGYTDVPIPMVEQGMGLSVIAMGAIIALGFKIPVKVAAVLVAVFAVFHGHAHGSEGSAVASFLPYAVGFIVATLGLHLTGIALAQGLNRLEHRRAMFLVRVAGVAGAVAGSVLLAG